MTLEELKKRATAAELTLIDAAEKTLREGLELETTKRVVEFITANPPPGREDLHYDRDAGHQWMRRLREHLTQEDDPDNP